MTVLKLKNKYSLLEYYNKLNDENSKPGIFFLKGPEGISIEIYKYGHRKKQFRKRQRS